MEIILSMLCLAVSLLSLSSAMVKQIPFPWGREIHGLLPLPIMKMFESQVAKLLPLASFTWTTSKEPECLFRLVITTVLFRLAPPVTMHRLLASNLMKQVILSISKAIWMLSFTSMRGSGLRMVGASWVTRWRIPFVPTKIFLTLHNLRLASSGVIWGRAKWPFVS